MPLARNSAAQARRQSATLTPSTAAGSNAGGVLKRASIFSGILRRELRRLIFRDQGIDDFAERFPLENLRQLVERQIDAVVGYAPLRIIVGADALGAVAAPDLAAPFGGARRILLLPLEVVEPRAQHGHCLGAVAVL